MISFQVDFQWNLPLCPVWLVGRFVLYSAFFHTKYLEHIEEELQLPSGAIRLLSDTSFHSVQFRFKAVAGGREEGGKTNQVANQDPVQLPPAEASPERLATSEQYKSPSSKSIKAVSYMSLLSEHSEKTSTINYLGSQCTAIVCLGSHGLHSSRGRGFLTSCGDVEENPGPSRLVV